jgi:gluconolactonase
MTKPDITIIATGLHFPEGPVELPDGSIAVVEIGRGRIVRLREGGKPELLAVTSGGPNGMALGPDGALYVCNNGGFSWAEEGCWLRPVGLAPDYSGGRIQRVDVFTGEVTTLYDQCDGRSLSGPNDIVFDNQGGFYFTDTGRVHEFQRDHGAVYYGKADGSSIKRVIFPLLAPNGIGLSPNLTTLYVAEMETARLWSYAIAEPGRVHKRPFPSQSGGELVIGLGGFQRLDSLKVAASGDICIALSGRMHNGGFAGRRVARPGVDAGDLSNKSGFCRPRLARCHRDPVADRCSGKASVAGEGSQAAASMNWVP